MQDGKRVLDCLQRALKIADVCMQVSTNVNFRRDPQPQTLNPRKP
jgi:hypothetical protein